MGRALVNKSASIDDSRGLVNKPSRGLVNKPKIRVKKRIAVIPFDGEENFIVPKRGGFGQPDNEHFVMVAGANVPPPDTPNDPTNTGNSGTGVPIGQPQEPIYPPTSPSTAEVNCMNSGGTWVNGACISSQPAPATAQQLCVSNGGLWVNGTCQTSPAPEPLPAETTCINSGGAWINGACVTSTSPKPLVDTLPNFPVWSTLDCTTLKDKIAEYNAILSTSTFAQNVVEAYNTEIAKAQAIYNGKCNVTPPAPIVLPPIGGGIFGGGGGGFGEPPTNTVAPQEKKSNMGLYLILGGLALLYFLTRKKKQ